MQNPFESGHIKNYMLLYASTVVIMVLFFIASSLLIEVKEVDKKIFNTDINKTFYDDKKEEKAEENNSKSKFKLMDESY